MPRYTVEIKPQARKGFRRLDAQTRVRILDALDVLTNDPANAAGVKRLQGREGYRLRVGDYRVIYEINDGTLVVLVLRVGHRREVYR